MKKTAVKGKIVKQFDVYSEDGKQAVGALAYFTHKRGFYCMDIDFFTEKDKVTKFKNEREFAEEIMLMAMASEQ